MLGGACVTEEVWPGARVSRASYVVSMLQPKIVSDLRLHEFGYRAIPLDPAYAAMTSDGPIFFFNEPEQTAASIAAHSRRGRRGLCRLRGAVRADGGVPASDAPSRAARAGLTQPARHRLARARGRPRRGSLQARRPRPGPDLHDVRGRPARRLVRARRGEGLDRLERRGRRVGGPAHAGDRLQPPAPRARGARRHAGRLGPGDRRNGGDQPGDRTLGRGRGRDHPHRCRGGLDRRPRRQGRRGDTRQRRGDPCTGRGLRRPPENHDPRPCGCRELPLRDRRGHAPLPDPRRLGEDQHGALRAAPL